MSERSSGASSLASLGAGNPFPGLRPFEEQDAAWFFGRGKEVNELLKRLRRVRFLAIVGPSGNGKSSLVKAGFAARAARRLSGRPMEDSFVSARRARPGQSRSRHQVF